MTEAVTSDPVESATPAFAEPLHVGGPNIGDLQRFNAYVSEMFERRWLTNNGPLVQEFEARVADFLGVRHCVATTNGTVALELASRALGLTGEVIVPAHTFVATVHALHWQGITPVFVDIDPETQNLDPAAVRRAITSRTTGILAVHLWGRAAAVGELQTIADEFGLQLLFDAAHAFGCSTNGRRIGGFGRAEVFSFHATKFFNTLEGGAITTDDDEVAEKLRLMRNFGFAGLDNVIYPGVNGKMTEICAAMGLTNLDAVDSIVKINRENYAAYKRVVADMPFIDIVEYDAAAENNFQYVVLLVSDHCPVSRDALLETLHAHNVLARKYFWPGCHRMQPYRDLFPSAGELLPHTEAVEERILVMPTGTTVSVEMIARIGMILRQALGEA